MIAIGLYHDLTVNRFTDFGAYMIDPEGEEVLLPRKYVPEGIETGEVLKVFVYKDGEGRPVATTLTPRVTLNSFACLQVKSVTSVGAFLEWGVEKDLLVPFAHQARRMKPGRFYIIYLFLDEQSDRLVASSKIGRFVEKDEIVLSPDEEVELLICEETDLGTNVIINDLYRGLLYHGEVFRELRLGERCKGYVKQIRGDLKVDVVLEKPGYERIGPYSEKILEMLKESGGFLPVSDKSSPDQIRETFEMSKKAFKKAIGALYKLRLIRIEGDGIHLTS